VSPKPGKLDSLAAMAAANPVSASELGEEIAGTEIDAAMARAVALGERQSGLSGGHRVAKTGSSPRKPAAVFGGRGGARKHRRATLGLGLVAATAISALLIFGGWLGGAGGGRPEFAAAAIQVAKANPRLLVSAPGWEIVRADEFELDQGELTLSDGNHQFEIHWYPAAQYERILRDRANVSTPEHGTLLGQQATTVDYGREEYATVLSPQGKVFIELRGQLGSRSGYEEILQSLRPVDVDTWLSAMPASTVRPEARSVAIDEMLRGIPLPAGFDASALRNENSIVDRDSLAVKVGDAVACAWTEGWIAAREAGQEAAADRAVEAVKNSDDWPIVRETQVPWFSNYAVVAREMRAGSLNWSPSGYESETNGKIFGFGPSWKLTLGCKGTYRREVDGLPGS
jgi:hypothetical protein